MGRPTFKIEKRKKKKRADDSYRMTFTGEEIAKLRRKLDDPPKSQRKDDYGLSHLDKIHDA